MGIEVEFDKKDLDYIQKGKQHYAIGTIHYTEKVKGRIIYLKASISRTGESVYIDRYKKLHPDFPHETTMDHRIEFGDDIVPHVPPTLISKNIQAIVDGLLKIPFLPKHVEYLLNLLKSTTVKIKFVGVGRLCYGNNETRALRVDISAEQEAALFNSRLMGLVSNPNHWAEHHHLAGTAAEVSNGVKGNYTALVSEFPMVS